MRGPSETVNRKPTVMVRIAPGTRSLWALIESQIVAAVESAGPLDDNLYVEILPGGAVLLI